MGCRLWNSVGPFRATNTANSGIPQSTISLCFLQEGVPITIVVSIMKFRSAKIATTRAALLWLVRRKRKRIRKEGEKKKKEGGGGGGGGGGGCGGGLTLPPRPLSLPLGSRGQIYFLFLGGLLLRPVHYKAIGRKGEYLLWTLGPRSWIVRYLDRLGELPVHP